MMSKVVNEVVAANQVYVREFGKKGELALPPARQFAILTCMDARLDPAMRDLRKATRMSFATPEAVPPMTRSDP
jgi:hypothetical protein